MTRLSTHKIALVAMCALTAGGSAREPAAAVQDRVPVLAELFTSEGCSSCPPADRLLEQLSKEQPVEGVYVVAMSEHVTYWDHQGWSDPFGARLFTERQQMYRRRLGVDDIFTPQLVIDGATEMVGSDTPAIRRALADAARKPKPRLTLSATIAANGDVSGSASGPGLVAGAGEGAELAWALTEDDLSVAVRRGENANRTLHHSGVVRMLSTTKIAASGTPMTFQTRAPSGSKREQLRLVAFVQSLKTRRVLSVGSVRVSGTR